MRNLKTKIFEGIKPVHFKNISSLDFVWELRGNRRNRRTKGIDIENIQGVKFKYGLKTEILNVAIYYVVKVKDEELNSFNFERVVQSLSNKRVLTVEQAMEHLEKEEEKNAKYMKKTNEVKTIETERRVHEQLPIDVDFVDLQLETTLKLFKGRCSEEKKKTLLSLMHDMIDSSKHKEDPTQENASAYFS